MLASIAGGTASCKKCTTCTATDTRNVVIATEKYCSTSSSNITTFENAFRTNYGIRATCKRE